MIKSMMLLIFFAPFCTLFVSTLNAFEPKCTLACVLYPLCLFSQQPGGPDPDWVHARKHTASEFTLRMTKRPSDQTAASRLTASPIKRLQWRAPLKADVSFRPHVSLVECKSGRKKKSLSQGP